MKYIKKFERRKVPENLIKVKKYWLLPTDDRFEDSLRQIGYTEGLEENGFLNPKFISEEHDYVFIVFEKENEEWADDWGWNPYRGNQLDDWSEKHGYKFCGNVNINDYELDANKYNL